MPWPECLSCEKGGMCSACAMKEHYKALAPKRKRAPRKKKPRPEDGYQPGQD